MRDRSCCFGTVLNTETLRESQSLGEAYFPRYKSDWETKESIGICSRIDEDRVVACSIWSPDQGISVLQSYRDYLGTVEGHGPGAVQQLRHGSGWFFKTQVCLGSSLDPQTRGAYQIPQRVL
jgi:hypothetical protein